MRGNFEPRNKNAEPKTNCTIATGYHAASPQSLTRSEAISYFRNRLGRSRPALSVWQFDSVGMLLVALVIVRQNPFEPTSLFFSEPFIDQSWLVIDNELFATAVTPKGSHFSQTHCFL